MAEKSFRARVNDNFANSALLAKSSRRQTSIKLTGERGTRILSENELAKFLHWLSGSVYTPTIRNVLRLILWTGCRTGEVCNIARKGNHRIQSEPRLTLCVRSLHIFICQFSHFFDPPASTCSVISLSVIGRMPLTIDMLSTW